MKREYGWCEHVKVEGFFDPIGGTILRITENPVIFLRWKNEQLCVISCSDCYLKEFKFFPPISAAVLGILKKTS
jgi:hypothetical protein